MDYGEFLNELLQRSDIVKIVSRYTSLQRKGGTYWGCCPFHHEKTPSFTVSPDKGMYYCFGCKAGGNAINFISSIESVSKGDAIRILAKEANLEVPQAKSGGKDYAADAKKKERLYNLMREAARHYHDNLSLPAAKEAREYLKRREVGENLIRRFGLGYSVSGAEIVNYLSKLGYTKTEMKEAGIAAQRADEYYDVFFGRLIFPIINNYGEVVSFGGRVLAQNPDFAKYRNGSQTDIFDKSRNIYAVNLLKKRKQSPKGLPYIIMCEGYMDVISLHKAGFDMAVASMGTSLTQTQAKLLKNYCDRIYISYDGDGAGQKATLRGLDILAEAGLNVKVVQLPEGLDPDDVIKKHGADYYGELLDNAITLPQFKINTLLKKYDIKKSDEKAKFTVEALKIVKAILNPAERETYIENIRNLTGYTWDSLYKQMEIAPAVTPENVVAPPKIEASEIDPSLRFILAAVLNQKDYCDFTLDVAPYITGELPARIYEWGLDNFRSGNKQGLAAFFENTPEEDKPLLNELMGHVFLDGDGKEKYVTCVKNLQIAALNKQIHELKEQSKNTVETSQMLEIAKRIKDITLKIKNIERGEYDE